MFYKQTAVYGKTHPSGKGKVLMIKGQFVSIDQGNRTERVAVGLGAGRSDVQANVQVFELTPQGLQQVDRMRADAKSGYKPGMAEMMGAGAIVDGHLLMSTVVSGVVGGASEMTSATVEADGKRVADKIAVELGNFFFSADLQQQRALTRPAPGAAFRYAVGVQCDWNKDFSIGAAYTLIDGGSAKVNQTGGFKGDLEGEYDTNFIYAFNLNLVYRF